MVSGIAFGSATAQLNILKKTYDKQIESYAKRADIKKDIEYFSKNIAKVETVDDLLKDYKLYTFTMKAFGLEDETFARAKIKKVLKEGVADPKSFANLLVDQRYRDMAKVMAFDTKGKVTFEKTQTFVNDVAARFVKLEFERSQDDTNPALRLALYFERKAPSINNWYEVLADKALGTMVRTALGLPEEIAMIDIDKQVKILEKKYDIANFKKADKVAAFVKKYTVMADMNNSAQYQVGSPILNLFNGGYASNGIVSIDPSTLLAAAAFRK